MADRWEELLPFYVAGTLDAAQRTALEKHMDDCETCRRSLSEWYVIGEAVRAEADSWARTLPLPRYNGQYSAAPPAGRLASARGRPRRQWAIATIAAAFAALLVMGSLILYMAMRIKPNDTARPNPTGIADNAAVAATQTALSGTLGAPTATSTDLGLITNTVVATPTITIVFAPTKTPTPVGTVAFVMPVVTATITNPEAYPTPIYGCMVRTSGSTVVNIFRTPESSGEVVDHLNSGDFLAVFTASRGWYELLAPNINLPGWVWSGDVVLLGADCATLPQPTPTMSISFGPCTGLAVANLLLRPDPYEGSPITARISSGGTVGILAMSDNYWYMVQAIDSSTGWTPVDTVSQNGDCTNLPFTQGYLGSQTPAPTLTPLAPPTTSP
ncbi:MAG: zf-HC2 domain-containing protein [Anaerolineae bacterium]